LLRRRRPPPPSHNRRSRVGSFPAWFSAGTPILCEPARRCHRLGDRNATRLDQDVHRSRVCRGPDARRRLRGWRRRLLAINFVRQLPSFLIRGGQWRLGKERKTPRDWMILIAGNPLSVAAPLVDRTLRNAADREWQCRKVAPAGSEMYLGFRRK